jgi:hypothetical protein
MRFSRMLVASIPLLFAVPLACGDRTGLLVDDSPLADDVLGGDAGLDARLHRDGPNEAAFGLDVVARDVIQPNDCPDAAATLVYVITETYDLYSFFPPTLAFKRIGAISCPRANGATPFSMAVDRQGIARIVFNDGRLFRVSTATAACQSTPFAPNQHGFLTFGMGYAADLDGGETLYLAADGIQSPVSALGSVDQNYVVHPIGNFAAGVSGAELTGTGGGQLFSFYTTTMQTNDTYIGEVNKQTANIGSQVRLGIDRGNGWAFAFWGGDFWIFTAPGGGSVVTRYRPSDGSIAQMTTLPEVIVGAGVSTCAPQQ